MMCRPRIRRLLVLSACFALVLVPASSGWAQRSEQADTATKFDEFEDLRWCDLSARLDNFAIHLQQYPDMSGYIVSYGPEGNNPGSGKNRLWIMRDYLVNSRGLVREQFTTIYGGRHQDLSGPKTELWIVPRGAEPPAVKEYENNSNSFTGKFAEFEVPDGSVEGLGPSSGGATIAGFADALKQQPKTQAYIVAYSSTKATTGAWRRVAKGLASGLESGHSVQANRIKIIFAGYDEKLSENDSAKVQLWILPADAPPPAKEATAERRPKDLVQLGTFDQYMLEDPEEAKHVFEGFADVLRADNQLRACIIVRPPIEQTDPEAEPAPKANVDLLQLVEKWKHDLAGRYKIDEGRLVVIAALATEEWGAGMVETWIVPPDAPLPDPYPPQEAEITEEVLEENPEENPQGF